jgi:hypothetical protein
MMRHGASSGYVRSKLTVLHGGAGRVAAAEFKPAPAKAGGRPRRLGSAGGGLRDRTPPRTYPRRPDQGLRRRQLLGMRQLHPDPQRHLPQMRHLRRDIRVQLAVPARREKSLTEYYADGPTRRPLSTLSGHSSGV